ncbi:MAG: protein arginine kinase [Planctomycetaceae bacterium]|nr:protein arginine kinase [Planctomycetaceae bacterium]
MLSQTGQWLRGEGPECDIVISCRVRLARNLTGYPFITRATANDRRRIVDEIKTITSELYGAKSVYFVDLESVEPLDRRYLLERQLVSAELVDTDAPRGVVIDKGEKFSVMVCEEDHLRMQSMTSGLDLQTVWKRINEVDDKLESRVQFAYHEKFGYLTACPTNVGTGVRVSVMLHLPGLVITKEIEKVFRSLQKVNLAVRGIYGEGTQALGDFFQISNQITLGHTEQSLLEQVGEIIPQIISYERQAREYLFNERHETLLDQCNRAIGLLSTAHTISTEEAMHHLSSVRLGVNMKILETPDIKTINDLLLHIQPAHLQKLATADEMTVAQRDSKRAEYLRKRLSC